MAEFVNEKLGARFSVPDRLTVREQLRYFSVREVADMGDVYEANWRACLPLVQGWQCAALPDPQALDLETSDDPQAARVMMWVANTVAGHVRRLGEVPKAS